MDPNGIAKIVTGTVPGPKSKELLERRLNSVSKGVSYSYDLFLKEAKGALIKDVDDNIFIDFVAGIGVQNIGHGDDDVIAAIKDQAEKYIHPCFNIAMYEPYVALAEQLTKLTPGNHAKKVMFANSGAEAVENGMKIARRYTKKMGIVSLECAYHGRTYGAMSITSKNKPYKYGFGPFVPETYKIPTPYCYRCPCGCTYPECGLECAEKFRTLLKGELTPDLIAAFIMEPVQGEGGFIVPPKEYMTAMLEICKSNNIVFIADEVQAGYSRTGKLFACENFDIVPDIILLSKAIASGMPISAVVGSQEIMDCMDAGQIGGTYCGNPVACRAGLEVLKVIENKKLNERSQHIGGLMKQRLNEMKDKYPHRRRRPRSGGYGCHRVCKRQTNKRTLFRDNQKDNRLFIPKRRASYECRIIQQRSTFPASACYD